MKHLVIVESPTKARTIKNFLDSSYQVIASKGHIRDLPKSTLGIKIDEETMTFTPTYTISKDHKPLVDEIKQRAAKVDKVYIATDEDREGEAIGFHIASILGGEIEKYPRITFHEITKDAILAALKSPRHLDMSKVNAQQARRLLDRIVGFKLSSLLSSKIYKGLSAGRVQSATLKLVVDRERKIAAFKSLTYYNIDGVFSVSDALIKGELFSFDFEASNLKMPETLRDAKATKDASTKVRIKDQSIVDKKLADSMRQSMLASEYKIASIEEKDSRANPKPPFKTSTLQQAASAQLGFAPSRTMGIAQRLYEGVPTPKGHSGVITYMRTDSLSIAAEALAMVRRYIKENYSAPYLPTKPNYYATKSKNAQEAHEAIRPSDISFTPSIAARYIGGDELKLYTLIFNRFVASQMTPAISRNKTIIFHSSIAEFKASGRVLVFDGFYKVMATEIKDRLLPHLEKGDKANLKNIDIVEKHTEPPARFNEASLIKELEALEIGRPSTYAPTISTLVNRGYIDIVRKQISATKIAMKVIGLLEAHFKDIVDANFTAKLEDELDEIAIDKIEWQRVLWDFYEPFIGKIEAAKTNIKSEKEPRATGESCPMCGGELVVRTSRYGEFTACSNYPKCKYIKKEEKEARPQISIGVACPDCGGDIVQKKSRFGTYFYPCNNYPKCTRAFSYPPIESPRCALCSEMLMKKELKKGIVYECSNKGCRMQYDDAFNQLKALPIRPKRTKTADKKAATKTTKKTPAKATTKATPKKTTTKTTTKKSAPKAATKTTAKATPKATAKESEVIETKKEVKKAPPRAPKSKTPKKADS